MNYQENLISRINGSLPAGQSLAPILADLLDVSMDSAYRRISGKTLFSLDESVRIAEHFNIGLDSLKNPDQLNATISFTQLDSNIESFKLYLQGLLQNLKLIGSGEDGRLYYSCLDIPVFQNLSLPNLAAFKMYYWMHGVMEVEELKGLQLEKGTIDKELIEFGQAIYEQYSRIPSVELWTTNTLSSTLRQIEFYHNAGHVRSREVLEDLYTDLETLVDRQERMAEKGTKVIDRIPKENEKHNFSLYESDIELSSNGALAIVNGVRISFIGHLTFNSLVCDHPKLNEMTYNWYDRLVRKSTLISEVSAKQRYQFISHLKKEIKESRERILG
jgi:hypothetical protein